MDKVLHMAAGPVCSVCGMRLSGLAALTRHMVFRHGLGKPFGL